MAPHGIFGSLKSMSPFNINLIIPFKDNKGIKRHSFLREIGSHKKELEYQIEELKKDVYALFGDDLKISLVARSDGGASSYYWRFKASSQDRKYRRLANPELSDYLATIDLHRRNALKAIEEVVIYINANLKIIRAMLVVLEKTDAEQVALLDVRH